MFTCIKKVIIIAVVVSLGSMPLLGSVNAIGTITIGLEAEVKKININQSSAPLIIHGFIGFEGVSVRPTTITLDSYCDVGEVILSRYEFVFHLPDEIPFSVFVYINPETENDTIGTLILNTYYSEGGVQLGAGSVTQIFIVLNYDENWLVEEVIEEINNDMNMLLIGIPVLIFISVIYVGLIRMKHNKNHQGKKNLSDK